jgi:hypothetical protein
MPAKSEAQRRLFAIAEHAPEKLYSANKALAKLPKQTLHDFAVTPTSRIEGPRVRRSPLAKLTPKKKALHPAIQVIRTH